MKLTNNKLKAFTFIFILAQALTWVSIYYLTNAQHHAELSKQLSISAGTGLGVALTVYVCYLWLLSSLETENPHHSHTLPTILGVAFTFFSLPFGLIVGIIGGGTLGGGWVSILFEGLNLSKTAGISIGIGLGVFIGAVIPTLIGTIVGFNIGKAFTKSTVGHKNNA